MLVTYFCWAENVAKKCCFMPSAWYPKNAVQLLNYFGVDLVVKLQDGPDKRFAVYQCFWVIFFHFPSTSVVLCVIHGYLPGCHFLWKTWKTSMSRGTRRRSVEKSRRNQKVGGEGKSRDVSCLRKTCTFPAINNYCYYSILTRLFSNFGG